MYFQSEPRLSEFAEDRIIMIEDELVRIGEPVEVAISLKKSLQEDSSGSSDEGIPKDEGYCSPITRGSINFPPVGSIPKEVFSVVKEMTDSPQKFKTYKIVLTGGPCGGKTTGMDRLFSFFENMGWKVFTVPETATILLGSKVKFSELNERQSYVFQRDLLKTMLQIENTIFNQAELISDKNVLVICDRGAMDPSAYMGREEWLGMLEELDVPEFDLLNNRYNQILHMVTAADGAEQYYTVANNTTRSEGVNQAKAQDDRTRKVWLGHPYYDIVDNTDCSKFEDKVLKAIQVVCDRVGIDSHDRLSKNSKKRKWLVASIDEDNMVKYEEYYMRHHYLLSDSPTVQVRIRCRMQEGKGSSYSLTSRVYHKDKKESVETRVPLTFREYQRYLGMVDKSRSPLCKNRRIFMVGNQYFNLDIYVDPQPANTNGEQLMFLETYTTQPKGSDRPVLPDFLEISKEVTGDSSYSMYKLGKIPGIKCEREEFLGAAEYRDD